MKHKFSSFCAPEDVNLEIFVLPFCLYTYCCDYLSTLSAPFIIVMEKKICGECNVLINDLEPFCCGLCETHFHISQQCCGINNRNCKDIFTTGKAIFICSKCRTELDGASIRTYFDATSVSSQQAFCANLMTTINDLSELVKALSKKIDDLTNKQNPPIQLLPVSSLTTNNAAVSKSPHWPSVISKPTTNHNSHNSAIAERGKNKIIDTSDLSVPSIIPNIPVQKFWLYLSGLNPLVTDDDVRKIISRCIETTEPVDIIRLVPKEKDISRCTFISFKIGLNPALKQHALNPQCWPDGIMFREFVEFSKNSSVWRDPPNSNI